MKIGISLLMLSFIGFSCAAAQSSSGAPSLQPAAGQAGPFADGASAQQGIDPGKRADIQRLLEIAGTKNIMTSMMDSMTKSIRPLLVSSLPPGQYREKLVDLFFDRFQSKADPTQLLESAVPIYDKHFSHEEIKSLIKFYETPLGQKTISVLPQIATEMHDEGQKWGEQLGREAMQQVLAEHPDLAEALVAAKNAAQPK
jgi:hypothetical protein